ncbi:flavodoxin [Selenomonas sp. TAMA-11512]|uniref:flavodoxin n=1 Tax=Selenomonas sp. TAMA-11512 TaxID=3095337 RepID=UPI003087944F|nr:flavodoxin [Selenomonas sp. TAMA-11512]
MAKAAVVFWSGTGNTEAMANAVVEGVKKGGAEVELIRVGDFSADRIADYAGVLFGCPACGTEELDDTEFEPFFAEAEGKLSGVKVGLFGSYGWGGGAFMETWAERTEAAGANMVADSVTCETEPDAAAIAQCEALGEAMAKAIA